MCFCRVVEYTSTTKEYQVPVHSVDDLHTPTACRQRGCNGSRLRQFFPQISHLQYPLRIARSRRRAACASPPRGTRTESAKSTYIGPSIAHAWGARGRSSAENRTAEQQNHPHKPPRGQSANSKQLKQQAKAAAQSKGFEPQQQQQQQQQPRWSATAHGLFAL